MAKMIYVHGDDDKLLAVLTEALQQNGYRSECIPVEKTEANGQVSADLALVCQPLPDPELLSIGDLTIDLENVAVFNAQHESIHFTPIEFSMLSYLAKHQNRVVPRSELLPAVWGFENDSGTRVADDTVKRLRKKLKSTGVSIETIWGHGFKIQVN